MTAEMTRADLIEILAHLNFNRDGLCKLQLDRDLRDLLTALRRKI
jgi:hypothetical protein